MHGSARIRGCAALVASALCLHLAPAALHADSDLSPGPLGPVPAIDLNGVIAAACQSLPRLHSLIVSSRREVIVERYCNGKGPEDLENVKSVSKSIVSALIGIAIDRGLIRGIDAALDEFLQGAFSGPAEEDKQSITIEDLLTMRAGLRSTSNSGYSAWILSENWVEYALAQPLDAPPGSRMQYSTASTHLLSAIITDASKLSTLEFARKFLAEPLGFELAPWPRDPQGIYFGGNDMELTPRQLVKFGELYLNEGRFGDRQIVPSQWVEASLRPYTKSPTGEDRYYGYGWWIATLAGYRVPHAWGYGGQFVMLVPDLDLVIVTTSSSEPAADSHVHANRIYQLLQHAIRLIAESERATRSLQAVDPESAR